MWGARGRSKPRTSSPRVKRYRTDEESESESGVGSFVLHACEFQSYLREILRFEVQQILAHVSRVSLFDIGRGCRLSSTIGKYIRKPKVAELVQVVLHELRKVIKGVHVRMSQSLALPASKHTTHYVFRFDIEMHHALLMNKLERKEYLSQDLELTERVVPDRLIEVERLSGRFGGLNSTCRWIGIIRSLSQHFIAQCRSAQLCLNVKCPIILEPRLLIPHNVKRTKIILLA